MSILFAGLLSPLVLGAGLMILWYSRKSNTSKPLDAREKAPYRTAKEPDEFPLLIRAPKLADD
jgi:hypothetical protein